VQHLAACSGFSITSDSVSSSFSVPRATEERDSTVRMSWIRSCRSNCRDETLTLAKIGSRERIARCQIASCRAVWSITNMPRSTINPISSAMVMNSCGAIRRASDGPSAPGLEAGDGAILQPHDRLVQYGDFLALDGAAQLGFQRQPVGLAPRIAGL